MLESERERDLHTRPHVEIGGDPKSEGEQCETLFRQLVISLQVMPREDHLQE